jgi:ATP-dependent DNA helicase DinG
MKPNVLAEISREIPPQFAGTEGFVLTAYDCAIFETVDEYDHFAYNAVNLSTNKKLYLESRNNPLTAKGVERMLRKLRDSRIAGAARLNIESDKPQSMIRLSDVMLTIFREVLPQYEYTIRDGQIALAEKMIEAVAGRKVLLAEAAVGIGKTLVYIIIGALMRRSNINFTWNSGYFPKMSYIQLQRMPILISTSSIALQRAILTDYIPAISDILVANGVIKSPLTTVLRKGKEHYVCEFNLRLQLEYESIPEVAEVLSALTIDEAIIDLAEIDGLTTHVKRKICVPNRCYYSCPFKDNCRYLAFREEVKNTGYDFQVCNHNLLLADAKMRGEERGSVLPPYQVLIIDEAHKLLPAARSIYGAELTAETVPELTKTILDLNFRPFNGGARASEWKKVRNSSQKLARKLYAWNSKLFSAEKATAGCDQYLQNIRDIAESLRWALNSSERLYSKFTENIRHKLIWELEQLVYAADALSEDNEQIRWFEKDENEVNTSICGIPKRLNDLLYDDLWSRGMPVVLTSGTLSVNEDFTALKQAIGLARVNRIDETTQPSPYNHRDNCLLYISKQTPFPEQSSKVYLAALTDEMERLIKVAHGHTAILFTSYYVMGQVFDELKKRGLAYPTFKLERASSNAIDKFKESKNGVLFAAGAFWEGIDIPGDTLSMLIIAKLPFPIPDAIGEYEQTLYPNFSAFRESVIMPDMLIRWKQGYGRGLRSEKDTVVVALCDCRANENGPYFKPVIAATPYCRITSDINDIDHFYRDKKPANFFQ